MAHDHRNDRADISNGRTGISGPFIRRPIGTSLLMLGLLFVGMVAYPFLPVAPLPQIVMK